MSKTKNNKRRDGGSRVAAGGSNRSTALNRFFMLAIIVAGFLVYSNSFKGAFVYDDRGAILENAAIREGNSGEWFWRTPDRSTIDTRPVIQWTLALNYALGKYDRAGYHLLNLFIHLSGALLLFGLVRRTAFMTEWGRNNPAMTLWIAGGSALWWTVHPLNTQAVTYIIQRTEALASLFHMATLYCACRSWEPERGRLWTGLAIASCALGAGSKETIVSAPIAVMLYDWTFTRKSIAQVFKARRRLYAGLLACWLILALLATTGEGAAGIISDSQVSPVEYFLIQTQVIPHYLKLAIAPLNQIFDYYDWPVPAIGTGAVASIVLLGAAFVAGVIGVARRRWYGFALLLFFMALGPSSSFVPLLNHAVEHRMYLALFPVVLVIAGAGAYLVQRAGSRTVARGAAACLVAVIIWHGFLTHRRNEVYASPETLWKDTVSKRPENPRAWMNLGESLVRAGRISEGISHMEHALEIGHHSHVQPAAHYNLANYYFDLGRFEEALDHYGKALAGIEFDPDLAAAYVNRSMIYAKLGKHAEAADDLEKALVRFGNDPALHINYAYALVELGRRDEAREHVTIARQLGMIPPKDLMRKLVTD